MAQAILRRIGHTDGPALVAANQASSAHLAPWVEPFIDMAGFDAWFTKRLTGGNVSFLAIAPDGDIAGVVNISGIMAGAFQSAYLSFYGIARFGGSGLMTDAVRQASRVAFDELGLHRLEANIQPANSRSRALVQRLGFRQEGFSPRFLKIGGEWKDHERWALLSDQQPS